MTDRLSKDDFRARLADLGLILDDKAFAAAWAGAQRLRGEVGRVGDYLAKQE